MSTANGMADARFSGNGHVPRCRTAVLLIDVINPMDFQGGGSLLTSALRVAPNIRRLQQRAHSHGLPVIYVNDNFDCWHLGFRELVETLRGNGVPGSPLIRMLEPSHGLDFYILKPSQSGFFHTGLEVLLQRIGARTLILAGFATDICVFFTASDAYMRGFQVVVPADCVAAEDSAASVNALKQMERLLKANVRPSVDIALETFASHTPAAGDTIIAPARGLPSEHRTTGACS